MTTTSTHTTYNVIAFQARDACILHLIVGGETWRLQQHSFPGCQMVLFFSFFFVFVGCECRLAAVEMSPTSSMEYYYYHPNRFLSLSLSSSPSFRTASPTSLCPLRYLVAFRGIGSVAIYEGSGGRSEYTHYFDVCFADMRTTLNDNICVRLCESQF